MSKRDAWRVNRQTREKANIERDRKLLRFSRIMVSIGAAIRYFNLQSADCYDCWILYITLLVDLREETSKAMIIVWKWRNEKEYNLRCLSWCDSVLNSKGNLKHFR